MNFKDILIQLDHNPIWLDRYINFLEEAAEPKGLFDRHHILPKSLFPAYQSFRLHSWNCIRLCPSDHLVAHYYLYRALPAFREARVAFVLMVGLQFMKLVEENFDESLVRDIAKTYEEARAEGVESTIKGWVKIYKTEEECSVCPPDQVDAYVSAGWKVGVPKRVWVIRGDEQHRVLPGEVKVYTQSGFVLGKNKQTEKTKDIIRESALNYHKSESAKGDDAYFYLPRGSTHHRRILGCPPEVAAKISKTLEGRILSPEHAAKVRKGATGKHWSWSDKAKQARSDSMKGSSPPKGLTMAGKTHSKATKELMSKSHEEFYTNNPKGVAALDAARPRGEKHIFYGKERNVSTRAKISASLMGRKQSEVTRQKRAESLREYHLRKAAKESSIRG